MEIKAKFINTEDYEVSLEITMSLKDWRDLRKQLDGKYPSWQLSNDISKMINKVDFTINNDD